MVQGGDGADLLKAGAGNDTLQGGNDNDSPDGDSGDDLLSGNAGSDTAAYHLRSVPITATIGTDANANILYGQGGDDRLIGGAGKDDLYGETGSNAIDAVDGLKDRLFCGTDADATTTDTIDLKYDCETENTNIATTLGAPSGLISPASRPDRSGATRWPLRSAAPSRLAAMTAAASCGTWR